MAKGSGGSKSNGAGGERKSGGGLTPQQQGEKLANDYASTITFELDDISIDGGNAVQKLAQKSMNEAINIVRSALNEVASANSALAFDNSLSNFARSVNHATSVIDEQIDLLEHNKNYVASMAKHTHDLAISELRSVNYKIYQLKKKYEINDTTVKIYSHFWDSKLYK